MTHLLLCVVLTQPTPADFPDPEGPHAVLFTLGLLQPSGLGGIRYQRHLRDKQLHLAAEFGVGGAYPVDGTQPFRTALSFGRRWGRRTASVLLEGGLSFGDRSIFFFGDILGLRATVGLKNALTAHGAFGFEGRNKHGFIFQGRLGLTSILAHGECKIAQDDGISSVNPPCGGEVRTWIPQAYVGVAFGKAF